MIEPAEAFRSHFDWLIDIKNAPNDIRREESQRQDSTDLSSVGSSRFGEFSDRL